MRKQSIFSKPGLWIHTRYFRQAREGALWLLYLSLQILMLSIFSWLPLLTISKYWHPITKDFMHSLSLYYIQAHVNAQAHTCASTSQCNPKVKYGLERYCVYWRQRIWPCWLILGVSQRVRMVLCKFPCYESTPNKRYFSEWLILIL